MAAWGLLVGWLVGRGGRWSEGEGYVGLREYALERREGEVRTRRKRRHGLTKLISIFFPIPDRHSSALVMHGIDKSKLAV